MMDWIETRKKSGMSQFLCARSSRISRMRMSLAETGQIILTDAEESAVRRALGDYISGKAREIEVLLREQERTIAGRFAEGGR